MRHVAKQQECCGCCPPCFGSSVGLCFVLLQLVMVIALALVALTAAARCAARHGHADAEEAWTAAAAMANRSSAWALTRARAAAPPEVARLAAHATNSTLSYLAGRAHLADELCDRGSGGWLNGTAGGLLPVAWLRALQATNSTLVFVAALWERMPEILPETTWDDPSESSAR